MRTFIGREPQTYAYLCYLCCGAAKSLMWLFLRIAGVYPLPVLDLCKSTTTVDK